MISYVDKHKFVVCLVSLPEHFVPQVAPDDCSCLRPAEPALLQRQMKEAWRVPQGRGVDVAGGLVLRPSLPVSVLPEVYDST